MWPQSVAASPFDPRPPPKSERQPFFEGWFIRWVLDASTLLHSQTNAAATAVLPLDYRRDARIATSSSRAGQFLLNAFPFRWYGTVILGVYQILECLRKYVFLNVLAFRIKTKLPSHQDFGEFALEVKKILQATPPKLRREMGMCATTIYVQQQQQY